ncbi:MAG TPA: virulence factor SrfC family protein, partial [Bradyrhizobium sp.]|nr:virulence factor SrfC family protein [Bradyrhizobium sp.]
KQAQVAARLRDLRRSIVQALSPHFVPTDNEKRLEERQAVAEQVISDFETCVERQTFGEFLRGLCLDRLRLADALYEACTRGRTNDDGATRAKEPSAAPARSGLLARIKSGGKTDTSAAPPPVRNRSRNDVMARCALELWSRSLHEMSDDEAFAASLSVSKSSLKEVATELIATSRRLTLESSIRASLDAISHIEVAEQAAAKATIVAERHINRFGTSLYSEGPPRPVTFDASGIGAQPVNFQNDFVVRWMTAFYEHAKLNALSVDGLVHDPEQNILLGQIIRKFETAVHDA